MLSKYKATLFQWLESGILLITWQFNERSFCLKVVQNALLFKEMH